MNMKLPAPFIWALALWAVSATAFERKSPLQVVLTGSNKFNTELFKEISKEYQNKNLISSTISAHLVLSMAAYGAEGVTYKQMQKSLHLPENEATGISGFQVLTSNLKSVEGVTLETANHISVNKVFKIKDAFKKLIKDAFKAEASEIDVNKPEDSVKTINDWVKEKTHHKIPTILQPSDVNELTRMVLLNAIYFKSEWAYEFNKKETENLFFTTTSGQQIIVPTMCRSNYFVHGRLEDLKAKFIEIPYKNQEFKMVIVMPDEVDGLKKLEENLKSYNYSRLNQFAVKKMLNLYLPKFKIETLINLSEPLKKLNFTNMFTDSANFSRISDEPLQVDKVMQKSYIEVNEEGSEAAGATAAIMMARSFDPDYVPPYEFRVDKPFYFSIRKSKTSLFQGHVVNPLL